MQSAGMCPSEMGVLVSFATFEAAFSRVLLELQSTTTHETLRVGCRGLVAVQGLAVCVTD